MVKSIWIIIILALFTCCTGNNDPSSLIDVDSTVKVASAMKNVMREGKLEGAISLDTISPREGLYGLGPVSYLTGEILIVNGTTYVSRVTSDTSMIVNDDESVEAPFLVYSHVSEWESQYLPGDVKTIKELESYLDRMTKDVPRPFTFRLKGIVRDAVIHIQNLPPGTKVSSPEEAHQGQVNYKLENEEVEIIGYFSTKHKGVFTHHDTYLHMHLLTSDKKQMGHLDEVSLKNAVIFLPSTIKTKD